MLVEYIDKKTYKAEQVLQAEAIWAVFYDNTFNKKAPKCSTKVIPDPNIKNKFFQPDMHII